MAAVTTVRDVLYHYAFARGIYERFIGDCERHQQVAQNAMGLLLWIDQGTNQVFSAVSNMNTNTLGRLVTEASSLISCLRVRNLPAAPPTPLLSAICRGRLTDDSRRFFAVNQGLIMRGVANLLDGDCKLIFDDRLYHLLRRHHTGLVGRNQELEAPYASVVVVVVPEDCRSMFVTFSLGQAVERDEIFSYFRETWGDCIVRVLMQKTTGGAQPTYGRVIFKSNAFVSLLLNGKQRVSIFIGSREIWLRKYTPRDNRNN